VIRDYGKEGAMKILQFVTVVIGISCMVYVAFRVVALAAIPSMTGFLVGYILAIAACMKKIHVLCSKENVPTFFDWTETDGKRVCKLNERILKDLQHFPIILGVCSILGAATSYALMTQNYLPPGDPFEKFLLIGTQILCAVLVPLAIVRLLPRWLFFRFFQWRVRVALDNIYGESDSRTDQKTENATPPRKSEARMTRDEAFKVLGLPPNADFEAVQTARKEAIRKFNVDQRQDLEPHIRDLVEEKFKQVNMAYDILKADRQA